MSIFPLSGGNLFGNMTKVGPCNLIASKHKHTIIPSLTCLVPRVVQTYYQEAAGAFVVFDVTRLSTFEAVQMWKSDLDKKVSLPNGKPIPAVLLVNKVCLLHTL